MSSISWLPVVVAAVGQMFTSVAVVVALAAC